MNLTIHAIGMTEDEADASLDHHGEPQEYSFRGCDRTPPSTLLLFKRPGASWGQDIKMVAACPTHADELDSFRRQCSTPRGEA